jgi:hypothetical protein
MIWRDAMMTLAIRSARKFKFDSCWPESEYAAGWRQSIGQHREFLQNRRAALRALNGDLVALEDEEERDTADAPAGG